VGRAGLEPATNGLWVHGQRLGDQRKRLADLPHIPCETTNLIAAYSNAAAAAADEAATFSHLRKRRAPSRTRTDTGRILKTTVRVYVTNGNT
jgi:hypothetical protein